MLFNRADAFQKMVDFFGEAGDVLYGQFQSADARTNVFKFGTDIGEAGLRFLAKACNFDPEAGNLGLVVGGVARESGKSRLD